MGFNFSGIVINKNFENKIDELNKAFDWQLTFQKEIIFEEACSNWKDENYCDLYFTEKGTFIFISMEKCADSFSFPGAKVMTYAISETSMAFNINYCIGNSLVREMMQIEGEFLVNDGEKMEGEPEHEEDISEIVFGQMEYLTGEDFHEIDLGIKAFRFVFTPETNLHKSKTKSEQRLEEIITNANTFEELMDEKIHPTTTHKTQNREKKKWWKIW